MTTWRRLKKYTRDPSVWSKQVRVDDFCGNCLFLFQLTQVIPPKQWKSRQTAYEESLSNLVIKNPIEQNPEGETGVYEFKHITLPAITYPDFIQTYQTRQECLKGLSVDQIQTLFWKNLPYSPPVYGADILGTLMQPSAGSWYLNELDTILQRGLEKNLRGVNTSYCYIGSWKSLFCWHKQDLDLDAINYLHFGKSKFWYCIQEDDSQYLEKQARKCFYRGFDKCLEYLRHKTCLINPYSLKKKFPNLKITKMEQKPNQFIIAFSGAYHCGFNFGINVAEAVNFATLDWLFKINKVQYCKCKRSSVKIATSSIVQKLISFEEYKNNPIITNLKCQLTKQEQIEEDAEDDQPKSKKTKKITKKSKKNLQKPPVQPNTENSPSPIENVKQIQCDICEAWHELLPENDHLSDQVVFKCSDLGKECMNSMAAEISQNQELLWHDDEK